MQTRKIYYEDCLQKEFTATVTDCTPGDGGFWVQLDATAFYPTGGGQACDLGALGDARVLEVKEAAEQVCHLCDRALAVGSRVCGRIDWQRRLDLMQQHTGEHILSGILHRRYGFHNTGFHVGADTVTVDFDGIVPREDLAEIEWQVNQALWQDLPVHCWYPTEQALSALEYRTKRPLPWPVRIVEVPGYDKCACCGVHVARTGQVGSLKILSCIKFHQGSRMEIVCGGRALGYFQQVFAQNLQVSQTFSAKLLETGLAAQQASAALAAEKFRAAGLEKALFQSISKNYVNHTNVLHLHPDLAPGSLRLLCQCIAQACSGVAAVASGENLCLLGPSQAVADLAEKLRRDLQARGGGKPGAFQGSVPVGQTALTAFFRQAGFDICYNTEA